MKEQRRRQWICTAFFVVALSGCTSGGPRPPDRTTSDKAGAGFDAMRGPGGPIAVIVDSGLPSFGAYYAEILRAEGLAEFFVIDLGAVSPEVLSAFAIAILAEASPDADKSAALTAWVESGGSLIAMRPGPSLSALFGIGDPSASVPDGYLLIDRDRWGISAGSIQYHGTADLRISSPGTTVEAQLFRRDGSPTGTPAVTMRENIGAGGGKAIAFMFDLARSIVETRQGNPALVGQGAFLNNDVVRSSEFFYRPRDGSAPEFIDLARFSIPQADEAQRFLANLIYYASNARLPLPRFWYLPAGKKAVVMMTGDDHNVGGTAAFFNRLSAAPYSPGGCSTADWSCARATSWIYNRLGYTADQVAAFRAQGFEIGPHIAMDAAGPEGPSGPCLEWGDFNDLLSRFQDRQASFSAAYGGAAPSATNRSHCFVFKDWDTEPRVEAMLGIRLDENYTPYGPSFIKNRYGRLNGSGLPMRFAGWDGSIIDVYQVVSDLDYEYFDAASDPNVSYQNFRGAISALLEDALGASGYFGIFGTHYDYGSEASTALVNAILDEVSARNAGAASPADQVALVSAQQMLDWLDIRSGASFTNLAFDGSTLTFGIAFDGSLPNPGLEAMLPAVSGGTGLVGLTRSGASVPIKRVMVVRSVSYAFFDAVPGDSYAATYR